MKNEKFLLLDIDDTVLGWTEGFKAYIEKKLGKKLEGRQTEYTMSSWIGLPDEEVKELVRDFNDNDEEFGNLKPIRNSEVFLPKFKDLGYDLVAITCSSAKEDSIKRRKQNIINVFGDIFTDVHCIPLSASKEEHLKQYPSSYWIEDKIENALLGKKLGHKGVMIRQPHNTLREKELEKDLMWVDEWGNIYYILKP